MKTYIDCFPCFLNQALKAASIATDDKRKIKKVLDEVGMMLRDIPPESAPPESGRLIYHKVREITENPDPYREIKSKDIKKALSLYPALKSRIEKSGDRLMTAIRIAIAGNVIDYGPNMPFVSDQQLVSFAQILHSCPIIQYNQLTEILCRVTSHLLPICCQ